MFRDLFSLLDEQREREREEREREKEAARQLEAQQKERNNGHKDRLSLGSFSRRRGKNELVELRTIHSTIWKFFLEVSDSASDTHRFIVLSLVGYVH